MFMVALFIITPNWKEPGCLFTKERILWYEFLEQAKLIYGGKKSRQLFPLGCVSRTGLGRHMRVLSATMVIFHLVRGLGYIGVCINLIINSESIYLIF